MSAAVVRATRRSLVLVDEFGASTYENDGASLLTACLDHWGAMTRTRRRRRRSRSSSGEEEEQGDESTRIIRHDDADSEMSFVESRRSRTQVLEVVREGGGLVPLYQVAEGRARASHAAAVASLAGRPQLCHREGQSAHLVVALQVCESIRRGELPPTWTLLEDGAEMRRCRAVVSLFLLHHLADDPLTLLHKIRECSITAASASPSSSSLANLPLPSPHHSTSHLSTPPTKYKRVGDKEGGGGQGLPQNSSVIPSDFLEVVIASGGVLAEAEQSYTHTCTDYTLTYSGYTHIRTGYTHIHTGYTHTHTFYTHTHTFYTHTHTGYTHTYTDYTHTHTGYTHTYTDYTHTHTGYTHTHTGYTHTHTGYTHTYTDYTHTHTGYTHTHTGYAHTHTGYTHTHTGYAHTHTGYTHTHTGYTHTHTGYTHTHTDYIHTHTSYTYTHTDYTHTHTGYTHTHTDYTHTHAAYTPKSSHYSLPQHRHHHSLRHS
ncbi:hypothetical protein O3P69_001871 [Scylla paramamosain]|uniref:DNA mismatch repair proteins mutS family domain-containing protein n=1 Tax=Scylla paramamosain TaxID=85552 RepID=A0AAW0V006_SCYPA